MYGALVVQDRFRNNTRTIAQLKCTNGLRKFRVTLFKALRNFAWKTGQKRNICRNGQKQIDTIWNQVLKDVEAKRLHCKSHVEEHGFPQTRGG